MAMKFTTKRYQIIAHLLLVSAAVLAFNMMDLDLFNVSKTIFLTLWSSVSPWLYPPYVYLLINFIIFFIFASSLIHSKTIFFIPQDDHTQSLTDHAFIDSSLVSQNYLAVGSTTDDQTKFHTSEESIKDEISEDFTFQNSKRPLKDVVTENGVIHDKRELRKSKTFQEGGSRSSGRRERYVKILSEEELDRRVKVFICRFKQGNKV